MATRESKPADHLESQVATLTALVAELQQRVAVLEQRSRYAHLAPPREPIMVITPHFPPLESAPRGPQA